MPEHELIQHQRQIMRAFSQANAQRAQSESDAAENLKQCRAALGDAKKTCQQADFLNWQTPQLPSSALPASQNLARELRQTVATMTTQASQVKPTMAEWIREHTYSEMLRLSGQWKWKEALALANQIRGFRDVEKRRKDLIRNTTPRPTGLSLIVFFGIFMILACGGMAYYGVAHLSTYWHLPFTFFPNAGDLSQGLFNTTIGALGVVIILPVTIGLFRLRPWALYAAIFLGVPAIILWGIGLVIIWYLMQSDIGDLFEPK